ncbi:hypothetical protein GGR95_000596 [Sulfitobacter undariae]|uniref:Uncharacterized protein n=1 Tax=Sulfitobacter undariae TaxID=1563671 RepID=A0A7W6E1F9_9RHOB|nr:hypothetical protein [Sulfitobacter undariae]MBB3992977.1 hypothetical protein [Sulfitobacter undariae]
MIDFLNGKKSLGVTYWVGVVGFGLILRAGNWYITQQYFTQQDPAALETLDFGHRVFFVACTIVTLLLLRAMVKAGFNNRKPGGWGWLGIAIAALGVANVGYSTIALLNPSVVTPRVMLVMEIAELNKHLPKTIDTESTLNKVEIIGDDLVYFYSNTLPVTADMVPDLKRIFTMDGIEGQSLCRDLEGYFHGGLENVRYEFTYSNQSITAQLTAQDCLSFLANE